MCTCETSVKVYTVPSVIITAGTMFDSLKLGVNITTRINSDFFLYLFIYTEHVSKFSITFQNSEILPSTELYFVQ